MAMSALRTNPTFTFAWPMAAFQMPHLQRKHQNIRYRYSGSGAIWRKQPFIKSSNLRMLQIF